RTDPEAERTAQPLHALHRNLPAHQLHKLLADRKPQPCPTALLRISVMDLREALKQHPTVVFANADPGVAHHDLKTPSVTLLIAEAQLNRARVSELDGIS